MAQPMGYQGESRQGLTARTWRISGLLSTVQWQALLSVYNGWQAARIQDSDTLLSGSVGTTVAFTGSSNGISVVNLPCWFVEPPSGEQAGRYINASVLLVDAAQALAVVLREKELAKDRQIAEAQDVDCGVVSAGVQRRVDETECELAALEGGLATDLAEQALRRERLDAVSKAAAYDNLSSSLEDLKTAKLQAELLDKQATVSGQALYAADLVAADLELQALAESGKATAYAAGAASLAAIQGAAIDIELLEYAAKLTARITGGRLENAKSARALEAVYNKYINEDLPDLGTVTLGGTTIALAQPMETRSDGPQVALTAAGSSYITGPLAAHKTRQITGYISAGSYPDVLSWYDSIISTRPSAGTWFPVSSPVATAEPFLIAGVKSTRYSVSLQLKRIL